MRNSRKLFQVLTAAAVILSVVATMATALPAPESRVQPILSTLAEGQGDRMVEIIVQKADFSQRADALVRDLGGEVTKDLAMIHSFAARVPASAAETLSEHASVQWVSYDAPLRPLGKGGGGCENDCPPNFFIETLNVDDAWDQGLDGSGIGVAIIDSGIFTDRDFSVVPGKSKLRIEWQQSFNSQSSSPNDNYGHGTHVAGIVGGNGSASGGVYSGVAPKVNLINLKISDDRGYGNESDAVDALEWVFDNKDRYNIRVVNLSIQSSVEQSYHTSPMAAAVEILWFNGVVVVAASGNADPSVGGSPIDAAPANDPFIITVGASHENNTDDRSDDFIPSFSASGFTVDGFSKPDIIAPGKDIVSVLAWSSEWAREHPERAVLGEEYYRISGTSMAAPMVTGAVALMLQSDPGLTPDQVKYRLMNSGGVLEGYPYLDVLAAISDSSTASANVGVMPHQLLAKMAMVAFWASENGGDNIDWGSVNWNAINWDAVNWNSVNWNAVNWNAVNWNAVNWNAVNWNAVNWNAVNWNAVNWNAVNWNAVNWNAVNWNAVNWNSVNWNN